MSSSSVKIACPFSAVQQNEFFTIRVQEVEAMSSEGSSQSTASYQTQTALASLCFWGKTGRTTVSVVLPKGEGFQNDNVTEK